ncbi:hypothetical protein BKA61DRAFT_577832 [Leptodontidium sp. MPI-SDFR-AT-0119]|nr:hypothetical protein BKA61DRAFT_577832 [Leptodontidium sp. MPI-SDFR-AT-0119]
MENQNDKNDLSRGTPAEQAKKLVTVAEPSIVKEEKKLRIALHLNNDDIKILKRNGFVKGVARRSGCQIDIIPPKEGDDERLVHFTGSKIAVAKAKRWVKELLTTSPSAPVDATTSATTS